MTGFDRADEAAGADIEAELLSYIDEMKKKYEKAGTFLQNLW